ncbi:MAG: GIY-YIG nuclease family protein [Bosea sp.]|uniref:GIY-YIG nuclease family protein n=1 Tax=Bosea sp. (in: a-proteobacteria) TaxID=1871050 RepID=UPI001ACFC4D4|nr:GIY-YIG nuclease family protein [Bosea sp. (in: a-proteobacteria)]MBN9472080.1 GIY-YIG nuclease family protein [Bosea sp. (in: a-proteobacteria)]
MTRAPVQPVFVDRKTAAHRVAPVADGVFVVRDSATGEFHYYWQDERPHFEKRMPPVRLPDNPEKPEFTKALALARKEAGLPEFPGHKPRNGMGYVYFLAVGEFVKIGFSRSPSERLTNIRRSAPADLDAYVAIPGRLAFEKKLHKHFADERSNGEWFRLSDRLRSSMAKAASGRLKEGDF